MVRAERWCCGSLALLALAATAGTGPKSAASAAEEPGFRSLFNGVDLAGWDGVPGVWSVEDEAITGRTRAEAPLEHNTFLIWKGGTVGDFELRLKFRFKPEAGAALGRANSGVQYRSRVIDPAKRVVGGYQADMDGAGKYLGMLYEERGRGILAFPTQRVRLSTEAGKPGEPARTKIDVLDATASAAHLGALTAAVVRGEWMDLTLVAEGRLLRHYVNGVQTAEVLDHDPVHRVGAGVLALQVHAGEPMTVQFKDVRLRVLPDERQGGNAEPEGASPSVTRAESLQVAPGFAAELVYAVPRGQQGSWIALTVDGRGRIIAADQYGDLYRVTPSPLRAGSAGGSRGGGATDPAVARVERLETGLGGAHGLLYAFDSLYVMVNESSQVTPGIWRLRDTDGDDRFDETKLLREILGRGEHGPHALVPGPDGRSIYFASGNHTALPTRVDASRPVGWSEDVLLPRLWDTYGHALGIYSPGGYVGRIDPDGKDAEIVSIGFRNHYDIAFDASGELFTYDSDMEWDDGMPWYVPTRINHLVSGGDYGWRSGSARWPAYFADSLPAVLDVGPGSPTGLVFGKGARFPARYQRALFACDWTYGTLYAVHLTPDGATYRGELEEFVAGKALPLTDIVVNPNDGALYFAVGGRQTQSALYRVTYTGSGRTEPVGAAATPPTPEAKLRRSLEALHAAGTGPEAIERAWPHLDSRDRFVRFAARVAIEKQPVERWTERALGESRPQAALEALIALARRGDTALQPRLALALERFDLGRQPVELRLPLLRAWQLVFTRMGKTDMTTRARIRAPLESLFPHPDAMTSRELAALLVYLDSPDVVGKTVPLLAVKEVAPPQAARARTLLARNADYGGDVAGALDNPPDRQQIAYAYLLRNARVGWSPKLRQEYFAWFPTTAAWQGGNSFRGFLDTIRRQALDQVVSNPWERAALAAASVMTAPAAAGAPTPAGLLAPAPQGPGRDYTVADATALVQDQLQGRDFARGKAMFAATLCLSCHRFNGEGGGVGPDISAARNRYSVRDLLESIIEPDRALSGQYPAPMPPRLVDPLNAEELRDLVAYIMAGGNPRDPMFAAPPGGADVPR